MTASIAESVRTESIALDRGLSARVRRSGGPVIFWIHGYTLDSSIWSELWALLPEFDHVAIDLPGHGASADVTLALPELGRWLGAVAIASRAEHLVGLSFGSMIALQIVSEYPTAYASVVLAAPSFGRGPFERDLQARNIALKRGYRERGGGPWMTEAWMRGSGIFAGAERSPALFGRLQDIVSRHRWSELATGSMQRIADWPQSLERIAEVTASLAVVVGDADMRAFQRSAELIARSSRNATSAQLVNAGHLCLLEAPTQAAEAIRTNVLRGLARPARAATCAACMIRPVLSDRLACRVCASVLCSQCALLHLCTTECTTTCIPGRCVVGAPVSSVRTPRR